MNNTKTTVTGEGNAPREQMRNYLNEHQYFIRGSSTVYDDRTGKAVTGEGNAPRVRIGRLWSNGKTLHITIDLRKLREGYTTYDAGVVLKKLGWELSDGFDVILTPEATSNVYSDGSVDEQ